MGIKVFDSISLNTGLTLQNLVLTIRGNFLIRKRVIPSEELQEDSTFLKTIYEIQTTVHYLVNVNATPVFSEDITLTLDNPSIDIYTEIYNRIKTRYSYTENI